VNSNVSKRFYHGLGEKREYYQWRQDKRLEKYMKAG
jgi:hypothetical protein